MPAHTGHVYLCQAEDRITYLNLFDSHCYSFIKTNLRIIRHIKTLEVLLATTIWPTTQYCYFIRPNKTEIKIIGEKKFGKSLHPDSNLQRAPPCDYYWRETLVDILLIIANRYCRRNARFPVRSSPHRKFQKCAARVLTRPDPFLLGSENWTV